MDNFSELDDCINTLEQLQLTLDFETSTVKRNTRIETPPVSPKQTCVKVSNQLQALQFINDSYEEHVPDIAKSSVVRRKDNHASIDEEQPQEKSLIEMLDFQSISVRRPKLVSSKQLDSDLFSVPECDTTDFPPPPPLPAMLSVDSNNYLKAYSSQTLQYSRSNSKNSSPLPSIDFPFQLPNHKTSTTSLKIHSDPYSPLQYNHINNTYSDSSSQSNISNYTDKDPKSINSFPSVETMSIREDPSKQTVVRFFTTDKTTKAIAVSYKMTIEQVITILMEKHFWIPSLKSSVVEKVPNLKMERFFEEHECLINCVNNWPSTCGNMVFFEPRDDIYGLFDNPKNYLNESYPAGAIDIDAIKDLFIKLNNNQHEYRDYLYIKKPSENAWKRKLCTVDYSGISLAPKKKSKSSTPILVMPFNDRFYLYTSTGGWTKQWDAPTPFGFAFKPYNVVNPKSDQIIMFCAADETSMRRWCSNIRLCKYKNQIHNNYQHMQNRSIYCSNLCSKDRQIPRMNSLSPTVAYKNTSYQFNSRSSLPTASINNGRSNSNRFI